MDRITSSRPIGSERIPVRIFISYLLDYLIIVVLAAIYAALDVLIQPFNQPFSLTNISLQYNYAVHERVPIYLAMAISGVLPALIILVYTLFIDGLFSHHRSISRTNKYSWKQRLWEFNCGILGLLLSQGAAFVITGSLKNLIGKPRPDVISRCLPQSGSHDLEPFGLSNRTICTQSDAKIMQDAFRSFPSGHSSSSFAGLFYLSLYLAAKLHVLDQRGEVWRTVIVLVPTLIASVIAGTRIMDARHHPFDVLFGSALGVLCAWSSYRQYFPPVSHTWEKGRAYPMRTWGVAMKKPEGIIGTDGMMYSHEAGKMGTTVYATTRDDGDESHLMEPIRRRVSSRSSSPMANDGEIRDYEHIRRQAAGLSGASDSQQARSVHPNTFRNQIARNETLRGRHEDSPTGHEDQASHGILSNQT